MVSTCVTIRSSTRLSSSIYQQKQEGILGPYPLVLIIPYDTHFPFSPDEYPFSSDLPEPIIPPLSFPQILYPNKVNVNPSILSFYTRTIVPRITRHATLLLAASKRAKGIVGDEEHEDDGNYGSAATIDIEILQAISKRVHYGTALC